MTNDSRDIRLDRIEGHLQNLDTRLAAVEQKLPSLAAKDDLTRCATKEDLKRFATKEDLKRFATKEDLKRFATKEDLKRFATKEDLKRFATKEDLREALKDVPTRQDPKGFVTQDDLKAFGEREGAAMREFVLEVVQKSSDDLRSEMRRLFELQNQKIDAFLALYKAERVYVDTIDDSSRKRDAALDRRISRLERA